MELLTVPSTKFGTITHIQDMVRQVQGTILNQLMASL